VAAVGCCREPNPDIDPNTDPIDNMISMGADSVPYNFTMSVAVNITSEVSWVAALQYNDGTSGWASLSESAGTGSHTIQLNVTSVNAGQTEREVTVRVVFNGDDVKTATLTQEAAPSNPTDNLLSLGTNSVPHNFTSSVAASITSEISWTATLQYNDGTSGWASLSENSGTGSRTIQLNITSANTGQTERGVTVRVVFNGSETKTATLTQEAAPPPQGTTPGWLEMPEVVLPNSNYYFVTHYANLSDGSSARNFSLLYDASSWTAYWIAYPMSRSYNGSSGRSDAWGYDPKIPQSAQVNLSSSYGGGGSGNEVNSRGHQVASGDRQATVAQNRQTFYYTNMTPQKQGFNGLVWERLESRIQSMAFGSNDTLWCVTGAIIQTVGGNETIQYVSKDGKSIPFPNYYYKVIIKKSGTTYKGIGFWFEHFDRPKWSTYPGIKDAKTIRQIEALTGFNFFYNLSTTDQNSAETSVDQSFWTGLI
jgi:DNA/RNA endonuclease G (NUC1)